MATIDISSVCWVPLYNYQAKHRSEPLEETVAYTHPLAASPKHLFRRKAELSVDTSNIGAVSETSTKEETVFDPLGASCNIDDGPLSPLSRFPRERGESNAKGGKLDNTLEMPSSCSIALDINLPNFESWQSRRSAILEKFTSGEVVSITSNRQTNTAQLNVHDRTAHRLEMLEDMSGLKKLAELSMQQYVKKVNEMKELLLLAWENNKRVESIRLVIELARTLSSTSTPQLYPSQWVLVTDVVDIFGKLVYDRILQKANEERQQQGKSALSKNFTSNDVLEQAAETAKNWFCKIADIKELLPRFYVETALIGCIRFLDSSALRVNLQRLAAMTTKIAHPVIAAYTRAYIARMAMFLDPADRAPHWKVLNDWMQTFTEQPVESLWPALEWIIQCVAYGAHTYEDLGPLWEYSKQPDKRHFVLRSFLNGISPTYLANHALEMMELVCEDKCTAAELRTFGSRLLLAEIPEQARPAIMKRAWKLTVRQSTLKDLLSCAEVWCEFAAKYFTPTELSVIAQTVVRKSAHEKKYRDYLGSLVNIVRSMVNGRQTTIDDLCQLDSFTELLNLIRDEPFGSASAEVILTSFVKNTNPRSCKDFRLAYFISDECCRITRSISQLSPCDNAAERCQLILAALDRFDLSHNPERNLEWLVSTRGSLCDVHNALEHILSLMMSLCWSILARERSTSKRANLLRACIANLYITIPSLASVEKRLDTAQQAALIALSAASMHQADALVRMCVEMLFKSTLPAPKWVARCDHFLGFLALVPDDPDKPILYFFRAVLNGILRKDWNENSFEFGACLIHCLDYLWAIGMPEYSVRIANVHSNDELYAGNEEFRMAVQELAGTVLASLLPLVESEKKGRLAVMLLEHLVARTDIEDNRTYSLCERLLERCLRNPAVRDRIEFVIKELRYRDDTASKELLHNFGIEL